MRSIPHIGIQLFLFLTLVSLPSGISGATPPNVILFFVDDMGWTDLGCFGSDMYETPHIDALAAQGTKFTNGYSACTVCSPSRAALMTGKYPARLHVTDFIPGHPIENTPLLIPDWTQTLKLDELTIAELLKPKGYQTAHIGKWHLTPRDRTSDPNSDGSYPDYYPDKQGFDFNIGGCERGAPASYFWPYGRGKTLEDQKNNNTFKTLPEGGEEGEYLTDRLADEAVKLIDGFGQDPFFIYYAFYNVHTPLQARPDLLAKYEAKIAANPDALHNNAKYAAMVESVDQAVGKVMAKLRDQGIDDKTMIIFSSDNGGLRPEATSNLPLRQGKGGIYEGGVRVPTFVRWPSVTKPGSVSDEPVISMDFLPTILEAAEVEPPAELAAVIDGKSLVPILKDADASLDREAIFWHYPHYHMSSAQPYSAIRAGDWKLIERHGSEELELYNLAEDIHEDNNLAQAQPEKAQQLYQKLKDWRESVGAQMPVANPDYDPDQPIGWRNGQRFREPQGIRWEGLLSE